ncbi:murein L,D-transpeptidase catalytic domain family protein [Sphingomonas sp. PR090111-T3T-6A]|uniref:murein L,D-transpeptidase catalytic domain family protein n=1 Tax=Sphingomonas sp. PR090111-T3T-6A TaxID=685778 RepID=UPI000379E24F|nr:murein L,D-transpeptidase catalytic domain family protein [Sphingomonas sp. PR090111-T3T-6A]
MATPFLPSRRAVLQSAALIAACGAGAADAAVQRGLAAVAPMVDPVLVARALDALWRHDGIIWSRDVVAIADFGLPSSAPRFHLIDMLAGKTTSLLVAHGKGSDPDHTGWLQSFSNENGSEATSEGAYLTGETYTGIHGLSRRLAGLDPSDANAEARAIVIHSARYVDPSLLATQGRLGRSDGCFAFSEQDIGFVLARLGQGRLLYAGRSHGPGAPIPFPAPGVSAT